MFIIAKLQTPTHASMTVSSASRETLVLEKDENKSLIKALGRLGTTTPASDTLKGIMFSQVAKKNNQHSQIPLLTFALEPCSPSEIDRHQLHFLPLIEPALLAPTAAQALV